ncbi:hypothetical protein ZWY2020_051437 [Hordeum vulgare]|nr:hypothetical protein ZWY2020_051437 [Hordeum vulgare]
MPRSVSAARAAQSYLPPPRQRLLRPRDGRLAPPFRRYFFDCQRLDSFRRSRGTPMRHQQAPTVLEVLSSSTELVDLLCKVDIAYHSGLVTSPSSLSESDDVLKHVPSIPEQLKDWEDGLTETDADGLSCTSIETLI